ncbi:MAG TPA: hypothetical protein VMB53_03015 [Gaiellaceae bacterium]|nr:hypothetical protein [Gaiellaceae bacterium]
MLAVAAAPSAARPAGETDRAQKLDLIDRLTRAPETLILGSSRSRQVGFPARTTSDAYLADLHKRVDFVVVDGEDIRVWGGRPGDFTNPTHIDRANMRRLLRYVVAHSEGALR